MTQTSGLSLNEHCADVGASYEVPPPPTVPACPGGTTLNAESASDCADTRSDGYKEAAKRRCIADSLAELAAKNGRRACRTMYGTGTAELAACIAGVGATLAAALDQNVYNEAEFQSQVEDVYAACMSDACHANP